MKHLLPIILLTLTLSCSKPSKEVVAPTIINGELQCDTSVADWSTALFVDPDSNTEYLMLENLYIKAHVVSSDLQGGTYKSIYFQETLAPFRTFELLIEATDISLWYPRGTEVILDLHQLRLKRNKNTISIGAYDESYSNPTIAPLFQSELESRLLICENSTAFTPLILDESLTLSELWPNRFISVEELMFSEDHFGNTFGVSTIETEHQLTTCSGASWMISSSGYEDFIDEIIPENSGTITGRLVQGTKNQIAVDLWEDVFFDLPRCEPVNFDEAALFISEIADPDNSASARFIELYNAEDFEVILNGWMLLRYTNDSNEPSHVFHLDDYHVGANSTFVIASNLEVFSEIYQRSPDAVGSSSSAANSNGDDTMLLVNPAGQVIDVFGVIGEDGTGTNHEFEDGRALRNSSVTKGNSNFDFSEWVVSNDSGDAGTIKAPKMAPDDFTPGQHHVE